MAPSFGTVATERDVRANLAQRDVLPVLAETKRFTSPYRPWLPEGRGNPLTEREREVVLGASRGLESRQIAAYLGIEYATVRTYKQHVLQKLNVHTMAGAVSLCLRRGWVV